MHTPLDLSQCQSLIPEVVPDFVDFWQAARAEWGAESEAPSACRYFSLLSDYVHQGIADQQALPLPALFDLIERLLREGDEDVHTAATTCFLENLQNQGTPPQAWVPLLGEASRAYCQAWDAYTGVATPGVWPADTPPLTRADTDLNSALTQIFAQEPAFQAFWRQHSKVAEQPAEAGPKAIYHLGLLARYVHAQISADAAYTPAPLLALLEQFNTQGNAELRTSVAAGFTQTLFALHTPPERWRPLLGPSMAAYAQIWAEIQAVHRP